MKILTLKFLNWLGLRSGREVKLNENPIQVIVGPNGSGKSSFARAVRALFWPGLAERHEEAEATCLRDETKVRAVVRGKSTVWQTVDNSTPQAAPVCGDATCHILNVGDLLKVAGSSDKKLAGIVSREMYGGVNPAELRGAYKVGKRSRAGHSDLQQCNSDISGLQVGEEKLATEEEGLENLDACIAKATQASEQSQLIDSALSLTKEKATLSRAEETLQGFSKAHETYDPSHKDRAESLRKLLNGLATSLNDHESDLYQQDAVAKADPLTLSAADEARLAGLPTDLAILGGSEKEQQSAKEQAIVADEARQSAQEACLQRHGKSGVSSEDMASIQKVVRARSQLEVEIRGLEDFLNHMGTDEKALSIESIDRGIHSLEDWLLADDSEKPASHGSRSLMWAGLAAVIAGVALSFVSQWLVLISLLGAGIIWKSRGRNDAAASAPSSERGILQKKVGESELAPPESWTRDGVKKRMRELMSDRASAADRESQRKWMRGRKQELKTKRNRLEELNKESGERLKELGLEASFSSLEVDVITQRIRDLDEALTASSEATALSQAKSKSVEDQAWKIHAFLKRFVDVSEKSMVVLDAAREELRIRWKKVSDARRRVGEIKAEIESKTKEKKKTDEAYERVFERLSLKVGDHEGLLILHREHDDYKEAATALKKAQGAVRPFSESLEGHPELKKLDEEALRQEKQELQELAAHKDKLVEERQSLKDAIQAATKDGSLEKARAKKAVILERLRLQRDRQVRNTLALEFLNRILKRFSQDHAPDVLQRAKGLFGEFTRGKYQLELNPDQDSIAFMAKERDGGLLQLGQLSDGTRMQLLIAVRLAFASHGEDERSGKERMPLVLDEALSTSDPDRFDAVAEALFQISDPEEGEGRQIIYMTANPTDVNVWNRVADRKGRGRPNVVPIDEQARKQIAAVADDPLPPNRPPAPTASGCDAKTYRERIGAPNPDHVHPSSLWLFYLFQDDLPLVELLLNERIETIGDWEAVRDSQAIPKTLADPELRERLTSRCETGRRALEVYGVGRGRSFSKEVLSESGAVSKTMLERVWSAAKKVNCNANDFVRGLRSGEISISGFKRKCGELIDYLEQSEYFDAREIRVEKLEF